MKKYTLSLLMLLASWSIFGQTIIENPKTGINAAPGVKLTKIEISDSATVLHFTTTASPGGAIRIPEQTFIQQDGSGDKLLIKRTEGITINEWYRMPASGQVSYKLFFPPIGKSAKTIDYGEGDSDGAWNIYDIQIKPASFAGLIPQAIYGNWFNENTGNWEVSFFDTIAVYKSQLWKYNSINLKKDKGSVKLVNKDKQVELFIKAGKNGTYMIGETASKLESCTTNVSNLNPKADITDKPYELPLLKRDSAIYCGYIKGYTSRIGKTTFNVYVFDLITGEQNTFLAKINSDGTFFVKFPMYAPNEIFVRSSMFMSSVFLEPGKMLFHMIDPQNSSEPNLFMGELAKLNSDLQKLANINSFNYNEVQDKILDMKPGEYKANCMNSMQKDLNSLDTAMQNKTIGAKAFQVKKMDIIYRTFSTAMEYRMLFEYVYRNKNKIPMEQRDLPVKIDSLNSAYLDFITNEVVNNPLAVISSYYNSFLNRVKYCDIVRRPVVVDTVYEDQQKSINNTNSNMNIAQKQRKMRSESLEKELGIKPGFATDLINAQDICRNIVAEYSPISDSELKTVQAEIGTPFISEYIAYSNNQTKLQIEANKKKQGAVVNEIPKTEADKLFDEIIKKYKGKVVYVDFWATWCSPCRSGIEQIKPLKEELVGENIAFVYITGPSSPKGTWANMIPDIKGEHYRVSSDEWNYLGSKFNITGIPHYMLVGKNGEMINPNLNHMGNAELKAELLKRVKE